MGPALPPSNTISREWSSPSCIRCRNVSSGEVEEGPYIPDRGVSCIMWGSTCNVFPRHSPGAVDMLFYEWDHARGYSDDSGVGIRVGDMYVCTRVMRCAWGQREQYAPSWGRAMSFRRNGGRHRRPKVKRLSCYAVYTETLHCPQRERGICNPPKRDSKRECV